MAAQETWTAQEGPLCNRGEFDAIFALMNHEAPDSQRKIIVRRVSLYPSRPMGDAGGLGPGGTARLARITAMTGGDPITAQKYQTASADLPAQVTCVAVPDTVTESGGTLRALSDSLTQYAAIGTNTTHPNCTVPTGRGEAGLGQAGEHSMAGLYSRGFDGAVQNWELNAGEGLAMIQGVVGLPSSHGPSIVVKVQATGAVYIFSSMKNVASGYTNGVAQWALMNAAGSGVTLEVSVIEDLISGESPLPGFGGVEDEYRLIFIDGVFDPSSEITPIAHWTTNAALPSTIKCYKGPLGAFPAGYKRGAQFSLHYDATLGAAGSSGASVASQQRIGAIRRRTRGRNLFVTTAPNQVSGLFDEQILWDTTGLNDEGLQLSAGQGIAIVSGGNGVINYAARAISNVSVEFAHVPPPAGGGGTFPVEDDVEFGVVYGPTDNLTGTVTLPNVNDVRNGVDYGADGIEFDGDLVLPVIGDVRLGTGYGADGTEFTGTLDPGAGGVSTVYTPRRQK
jgi:hypothetical protein